MNKGIYFRKNMKVYSFATSEEFIYFSLAKKIEFILSLIILVIECKTVIKCIEYITYSTYSAI